MRPYLFIICLLCHSWSQAQVPFSATWSFNGNTGSSISHLNVNAIGPSAQGVNIPAVGSYVATSMGQAVNYANWSTAGCNLNEWVEVGVQPVTGQTMTVTQLSFFFNRSGSGPAQVRVRSSADNFASDLYSQAVTDGFQLASISVSGPAYTAQSGAIRFRITACQNAASGGSLRLDELSINGTVTTAPLPVSLLYFRAQPQATMSDRANRVQLSWATTWERDADRFEVQRSRSLSEFGTIGQLPARGTTDTRQVYEFMDNWPDAGTSYYRLRQVDRDGTASYSQIVAIVLDEATPSFVVVDSDRPETILVKGRNLTDATFSVVSVTGQVMPIWVQTEVDGSIRFNGPLRAGLYIIRMLAGQTRLNERALVR